MLRAPTVLQRPTPSHSDRSASRTSQRPTSRLSQRTITKQPHLAALLKTLVKHLAKPNEGCAMGDIQEATEMATRRLDQVKQASVPDLRQIDVQFRGHILKARINVHETLADVLHEKYAELKVHMAQHKDFDMEIKPSTLPKHLQFLLLLSSHPTSSALLQAKAILARRDDLVSRPQTLTWENILKEEPFEGQHWQGVYGSPRGTTIEDWEDDTSDSLSLLNDTEYEENTLSDGYGSQPQAQVGISMVRDSKDMRGRAVIEKLYDKQYWRSRWRSDVSIHQMFEIGEPSSLGPTLNRISLDGFTVPVQPNSFVNEIDVVREVFMLLQGRESCLFQLGEETSNVKVLPGRRIVHFTCISQASILNAFAAFASTLNPLRHLVAKDTVSRFPVLCERCRTFEAFLAAVERQLHKFDLWCASKEEHIGLAQRGGCFSDHVVSLLSLHQEVEANISGTFVVLLRVTRMIECRRDRSSSVAMSSLILNSIMDAIRTRLEANDTKTAGALVDVWRESAEPLWRNLEHWLKDGIPIRASFDDGYHKAEPTWDQNEFFIRDSPLTDIGSPDFWEGSYTLSPSHDNTISGTLSGEPSDNGTHIPLFLMHVAEDVLAAGKAVGLLRAINMMHLVHDDWLGGWMTFQKLTESLVFGDQSRTLENLISDTLLPRCRLAQSWLRQVLVDECELWKHIQGMENIYLMTRGDAMSRFSERLFTRMDSRQPWNDFHFLNTVFREVVGLGSQAWIDASLVRFSHRGNRDRNISRTVRAVDGLAIEYAVPFPLTYLFGPESSTGYSLLFCFLLQIRRSKSVLDRILIRGLHGDVPGYGTSNLRVIHILRCKLSWFVNTLMNFIMTNVVHAGLLEFHKMLRDAGSLDEMISVHRSHLERLLGRCLLQPNTSALHGAILSVLDLSLHFGACLSAFAGDTSLSVSRRSLLSIRHRHRRKIRGDRARKLDIIGFTGGLPLSGEEESDSDANVEDVEAEPPVIPFGDLSISLVEESFFTRLDRISLELDGLVRFVRRGVESLAAGPGDASATFGVFAFCLENWEL